MKNNLANETHPKRKQKRRDSTKWSQCLKFITLDRKKKQKIVGEGGAAAAGSIL